MIEMRITADGPWLLKTEKLMTDSGIVADQPSDNFRKVRCNFLQALMQNIEERFQDTDVIESMSVLDLQEQEDILTFLWGPGDANIGRLLWPGRRDSQPPVARFPGTCEDVLSTKVTQLFRHVAVWK